MANSSVFTISSGAQSKLPRSQNLLHGITGNWMKGVCTYWEKWIKVGSVQLRATNSEGQK